MMTQDCFIHLNLCLKRLHIFLNPVGKNCPCISYCHGPIHCTVYTTTYIKTYSLQEVISTIYNIPGPVSIIFLMKNPSVQRLLERFRNSSMVLPKATCSVATESCWSYCNAMCFEVSAGILYTFLQNHPGPNHSETACTFRPISFNNDHLHKVN